MMSSSRLLSRILLAFAVSVLLVGAVPAPVAVPAAGDAKTVAASDAPATETPVVVYYFHGKQRCKKCRTIEAYAEEAVRTSFAEDLGTGALAWKTVNYDESQNEHYLYDFELPGSSLVVVEMQDGQPVRFEVLQDVWTLVGDKDAFFAYVRQAVGEFLG